jgi:hypothetical protein
MNENLSLGTLAASICALLFLWACVALWGLVLQYVEQWRVERKNLRARAIAKAIDNTKKPGYSERPQPWYSKNK